MLDFKRYSDIIINFSPVDMRKGIDGLMMEAQTCLDKDSMNKLREGKALLIFTGKRGNLMKILGVDAKGEFLINRRLRKGGFQRLKGRVTGFPTMELTLFEMEQYWDGNRIQVTR